MEFKDRLRNLRIENHLTQQELGAKAGLKKEAIYKYEKGIVVNPKRDVVALLASALNVSPCYLLCLSEERKTSLKDFSLKLHIYTFQCMPMFSNVANMRFKIFQCFSLCFSALSFFAVFLPC